MASSLALVPLLPLLLPSPPLVAFPAEGSSTKTELFRDSDQDGISDRQEIHETGTDPLRSDTDGDGVVDSREDQNFDGIVGPGESDPLVPGLFPGAYPHIPEPMVFDLVRGLGARKGELESNVLALGLFAPFGVAWAPEVEWAFADGHAVELELPIHNLSLEAVKLAVQGTLPDSTQSYIQGWQVIGEYFLPRKGVQATALFLAGLRANPKLSFMGMLGARGAGWAGGTFQKQALANFNTFVDLKETITLGLETNLQADRHRVGIALIPQLHWQTSRHYRLQVGGGISHREGRSSPLVAFRVVVE